MRASFLKVNEPAACSEFSRMVRNLNIRKGAPFRPARCCTNRIGPPCVSQIAAAVAATLRAIGFRVVVQTVTHRTLLDELRDAGRDSGLRLIGDRALDSLRLEKGYGIWSAGRTSCPT